MPGIFVSHAAADRALVDEFVEKIVHIGCGVGARSIFYSSGIDTGVPTGANLNEYVRQNVSGDRLVVALITPTFQTRPYCVAELGAAWSRGSDLFPLSAPGMDHTDLEGVLSGTVVRSLDDEAALDELHERISKTMRRKSSTGTWTQAKRRWLSFLRTATIPLPKARVSRAGGTPTSGSKRWGQLFDSFVDAALCTGDDSVAREEILHAAEFHTLVPGRYLYASDAGADNWIRLCQDPMYRLYRDTAEFWASSAGKEMADLIMRELGRRDFDYVSLGSGDGQKDAELVSNWLEAGADVFYYPYDVSLPLVSKANDTVREKVVSGVGRFHTKAVLADFNQLKAISEVFKHRDSPNVVALLGNSLGNLEDELQFLRKLRLQMSSEDLLILEVRLTSDHNHVPELATPKAMRFDFGALEHYLGLPFDQSKMTIRSMQMSAIAGTTTTVVGCSEVEFQGKTYHDVSLICIHEYTAESFLKAIRKNDFEVVESTPTDNDEEFLVCILRRRR